MKTWSATVTIILTASIPTRGSSQHIRLSAGLQKLEQAVRSDSNDPAAHYNVALAYWNAKRWADVDSELHRSIRLDSRFAAAYMALAGLPYAERDQLFAEEWQNTVPEDWVPRVVEADRMYRRAMLLDPLVEVRIGYVLLPDPGKFPTSLRLMYGEWLDDYFEGEDLYFEGKYADAFERFQRVYNTVNGASHVDRLLNVFLFWHGLSAAQTTHNDVAVQDFATLLERYLNKEKAAKDSTLRVPLRTNEYRYLLGVMKQRAGAYNEAIALYRESVENDVGLYMAHVRLADVYEDHQMIGDAVGERRAAVNANPDDPTLLLDLGKTLAHAGQFSEAEQAFKDAIKGNARDPRPHYYLGVVAQRESNVDLARTAYTDFISLAPSRYSQQVADAKQRLATLH
jgi:tetratricopeptide (TPR) repeat protein